MTSTQQTFDSNKPFEQKEYFQKELNAELQAKGFNQLPLGQRHAAGKDCVFCWFFTKKGHPYAKHFDGADTSEVAYALAVLRWDGSFGAPGGKVEKEENLQQGLIRELVEEVGSLPDLSNCQLFSSLTDGNYHIHAYALELTMPQLTGLRSILSTHLFITKSVEATGAVLVPLFSYKDVGTQYRNGIELFLQNQFAATAKAELLALKLKLLE